MLRINAIVIKAIEGSLVASNTQLQMHKNYEQKYCPYCVFNEAGNLGAANAA